MDQVASLTYTGPEPGSPEQVSGIIEELRRLYPGAKCTLNFSNPLELMIATQLAAQCTDERVNIVSELLSLPGVARKTANVVLGNAFGVVEGFTVDTHNIRLSRRFGWTTHTDAAKVEQDLMRIVPEKDWFDLSHLMIFHGRAICVARKPLCEECALAKLCPSAFVRPA